MRRAFLVPSLALAPAVLASLGACGKRGGDAATRHEAGGGAPAAGITPEQAAQVLARVGQRTITVGDYVAALEHMDQFDRMRYQAPERRQELLGEMIDVMLLADVARERGYDKDAITQQEIREILRDAMLKKAREGLEEPSEIPAVDVRGYFEEHKAEFHEPERRRVSAIVLAAPDGSLLEAAQKATAVQWGELVRNRSLDPHARSAVPADLAGDLGFVSPPGDPAGKNPRVPEEVRAAVFEPATVGQVVPRLVRSGGQFYVVRLASKTEPHDRSFEEAERAIRVKLAQERIQAREAQLLEDLRKRYPVRVDEPALSDVHVDLPRSDGGG